MSRMAERDLDDISADDLYLCELAHWQQILADDPGYLDFLNSLDQQKEHDHGTNRRHDEF